MLPTRQAWSAELTQNETSRNLVLPMNTFFNLLPVDMHVGYSQGTGGDSIIISCGSILENVKGLIKSDKFKQICLAQQKFFRGHPLRPGTFFNYLLD